MSDPTIICPKCHSEIKLTESLAAPLLESTKKAYEQRLSESEERIQKREATLREQESALRASKDQLEEELAKRLQESRKQIAEEESKKARQALSLDLDQKTREVAELNEVLKTRDEKLAEAQKAQADLLRKQRELEDPKRELY